MRGLDSITNSVDMNLSKFWEMAQDKDLCVLKSMDSEIVGHDLVTENNNNNIVCP